MGPMTEHNNIAAAAPQFDARRQLVALGGHITLAEDPQFGLGLRQITDAGLQVDIYEHAARVVDLRTGEPGQQDTTTLPEVDEMRVGDGTLALMGPSSIEGRRRFLGVTGAGEVVQQTVRASGNLAVGKQVQLPAGEPGQTLAAGTSSGTVAVPGVHRPARRTAAPVRTADAAGETPAGESEWLVQPNDRLRVYTVKLPEKGPQTHRLNEKGETVTSIMAVRWGSVVANIHGVQRWPEGVDHSRIPRGDDQKELTPSQVIAGQIKSGELAPPGELEVLGYMNTIGRGKYKGNKVFNAIQIRRARTAQPGKPA
jgi:hypothetical protein